MGGACSFSGSKLGLDCRRKKEIRARWRRDEDEEEMAMGFLVHWVEALGFPNREGRDRVKGRGLKVTCCACLEKKYAGPAHLLWAGFPFALGRFSFCFGPIFHSRHFPPFFLAFSHIFSHLFQTYKIK